MAQYLGPEDIFVELEVSEVGVDHVICQGQQLFLLKEVNTEGGPLWDDWELEALAFSPSAQHQKQGEPTEAFRGR